MTDMVTGLGGASDFGENFLEANDDESTDLIDVSSVFSGGLNFFGQIYSGLYVNNNGSVTFGDSLSAYTPFGISASEVPVIAAFFGDVDTSGGAASATPGGTSTGSNLTWYDLDSVNHIFTVTWDDVGYFDGNTDQLNAFQMQLVQVGDNGDFDIHFIYEDINWTTGDVCGCSGGLGGVPARIGLSDGHGSFLEYGASGDEAQLLALETSPGELTFHVRNGVSGDDHLSGSEFADILFGGAGTDTLDGLGDNDLLDGGIGADALSGGLGDDTYIVDDAGDVVVEDAGEGTDTVQTTLNYVLGAEIENLTLTGALDRDGDGNALDNVLNGNAGNNILKGLDGNDTLDGGEGTDSLYGGLGDDMFIVDDECDLVVESANQGSDTVRSSVNYLLGANIENLVLLDSDDILGIGNGLNNTITGNGGSNLLDGGSGADSLLGGIGDDFYIVDLVSDVVIENLDEGTDTVVASVKCVLGANIENLILTGALNRNGNGNGLDNLLIGNLGNNVLKGLDGNDILDGDAGADSLYGGQGDDTFVVDNAADVVVENASEGYDNIQSYISFVLGANIEDLILNGADDINGTGNRISNIIAGNTGANLLNGGLGADVLIGWLGDDTYVVDNVGDVAVEDAGEGTDTVQSSVKYMLGANVENLILTGTLDRNGNGNALDNLLTGNSGNNILKGLDGNDTLNGGAGSDSLYGGLDADAFLFELGSGIDIVKDFSAAQNDMFNINAYTGGTAFGGGVTIISDGLGNTVINLGGGNIVTVMGASVSDVTTHMVW